MAENAQRQSENAEKIKAGIDENTKAIDQAAVTAQGLNDMIQKFKI